MKVHIRSVLLFLTLANALLTNVSASQAPAGPTMDETKAWLESEGRDLMRANRLQADRVNHSIFAAQEQVETFTLNGCTLFWRAIQTSHTTMVTTSGSRVGPDKTRTSDVVLMLRDLSIGSISVEPDTLLTDAPIYAVKFTIRQPLEATSTTSIDSGNSYAIKSASLPVQTAEDGQRIANAAKHAVALCGGRAAGVF